MQKLNEKYLSGQTTLEEEKELVNAIHQTGDKEYDAEKALNLLAEINKKVNLSDGFDQKLWDKLGPVEEAKTVRLWPIVTGIAASVVLVLAFTFWPSSLVYETGPLAKSFELSDGSVITLNKNSALVLSEDFGEMDRKVSLTGEAFFEVARNTEKPFIIKAGISTTTVLGTSFNIRSYDDEGQVEISVSTGKVSFESGDHKILLTEAENATMDKKTATLSKQNRASENTLSWKSGTLVFENATLREVVRDVERHFDVEITVTNEELLDCRFKGTFEHADLPEILSIFEFSMDIAHSQQGEEIVLSGMGCKN